MKTQKIEISAEEAEAILERVQASTISQEDYEIIKGMVDTLLLLNQAVAEKATSIKRLLQVIFGHKTEKKKRYSKKKTKKRRKKKNKGHGKIGADEYTGASREKIDHDTLQQWLPWNYQANPHYSDQLSRNTKRSSRLPRSYNI